MVVTIGNTLAPGGAQGFNADGSPYVNWRAWKPGAPLPPGYSVPKVKSRPDWLTYAIVHGLPYGLIRADVVADEFLRNSGISTPTNRGVRFITHAEAAELSRLMGTDEMRRDKLYTSGKVVNVRRFASDPLLLPEAQQEIIELKPRPDFISRLGKNLGNTAKVAVPVAAAVVGGAMLSTAMAGSGAAGGAALSGATAAGVTTGAGVTAARGSVGAGISSLAGSIGGAVSSVSGVVSGVAGVAGTVAAAGGKLKDLVGGGSSGDDEQSGADQANAAAVQTAIAGPRYGGLLLAGGAILFLFLLTRKR